MFYQECKDLVLLEVLKTRSFAKFSKKILKVLALELSSKFNEPVLSLRQILRTAEFLQGNTRDLIAFHNSLGLAMFS